MGAPPMGAPQMSYAHADVSPGLALFLGVIPGVGAIYNGTVVKIVEFGAFVNIMPKTDGLVHISEISARRIKTVNEVLKEGDKVKVKCIGTDDRGKIKLSMKVVDQVTGQEIQPQREVG